MEKYEFLKYLTVYMKGYKKTDSTIVFAEIIATGFYAKLNIKGKKKFVIITAKHFATEMERVTFYMHYKENNAVVTVPISRSIEWHYTKDSDLAYCELKPIEDRFKKITGKEIYATAITEDNILTENEIKTLSVLKELVMVGYPKGESSTYHKYPLFKKGYTASLPKDTIEDDEGYVDMSAIGGFSGSPIFLDNDKLKFLGMLVGGLADDINDCSTISLYVPSYKIFELAKEENTDSDRKKE